MYLSPAHGNCAQIFYKTDHFSLPPVSKHHKWSWKYYNNPILHCHRCVLIFIAQCRTCFNFQQSVFCGSLHRKRKLFFGQKVQISIKYFVLRRWCPLFFFCQRVSSVLLLFSWFLLSSAVLYSFWDGNCLLYPLLRRAQFNNVLKTYLKTTGTRNVHRLLLFSLNSLSLIHSKL